MKFYLILAMAIIASASAEDSKPEPEAKPMEMEWKAKYGEYGYEGILPIQYNVPGYRYGYRYPYTYPAVPYTYPAVPYPLQLSYRRLGEVVTSYDPDYFSSKYGYYPDH